MMAQNNCPVCGSTKYKVIHSYNGVSALFKNMQLLECEECHMVFAGPAPSEEDLEKYNAGYFENAHGGRSTNNISIAFFYAIARLRFAFLKKFIAKHAIAITRVLEIGPGHGYFAENWLQHYPQNKYLAIESDASCFDSLKDAGVQIINDVNRIDEVDAVVMSHVLEHITPPKPFIKTFTNPLRKNGVLFIEVPCQDWKHKKIVEPHLLFFEKRTMTKLLEDCGFENIEVAYYGKKISELQQTSFISKYVSKARNLLIRFGIIFPFSSKQKGMEELPDAFERVAVAPYKAHEESSEPAWWLRAVATKK